MDRLRAKIDYILKHNIFINKSFKFLGSLFFRIWGVFVPVDNKKVLFSGHSRKYNDSTKAIYEAMLKDSRFKGFTFVWALEDPGHTNIPGDCIKIKADTLCYFWNALSSKYWITCVNIERSLNFKKDSQIYLNTWHGIPIKTIGNEAAGRKDYDFSYIDYFCISGDSEIDIYKKSFNIVSKQIIKSGLPRNDTLYNVTKEEVMAIKEKMGLPLDRKIILYAPTWRDSKDGGSSYAIKPPINIKYWQEKLQDNYILLFRTHPYTNKLIGVEYNNFVRDYVNYPDINDLLKISDVLISDYSATIFDFSILERPIICFAYDYDEYAKERGFTMDIRRELPSGICGTEKEVVNRIINMDLSKEIDLVRTFKRKYNAYGGNATSICISKVFGK